MSLARKSAVVCVTAVAASLLAAVPADARTPPGDKGGIEGSQSPCSVEKVLDTSSDVDTYSWLLKAVPGEQQVPQCSGPCSVQALPDPSQPERQRRAIRPGQPARRATASGRRVRRYGCRCRVGCYLTLRGEGVIRVPWHRPACASDRSRRCSGQPNRGPAKDRFRSRPSLSDRA